MSLILDVADDVTNELNEEFGGSLIARREYLPELNIQDFPTTGVKCTVVPKDKEASILSRNNAQNDIEIDIAIQKKLTTIDPLNTNAPLNSEIDPITILIEQIQTFFFARDLETVAATCVKAKYAPFFAPEHIREKRLFTGVLNLTFRNLGGLAMSTFIGRDIAVTGSYLPLSATQLIAIVELTAPPSNAHTVYLQGDDGSDVPMIPGEYHSLYRVDLHTIKIKGTPGDVVTIVGGTT